jgi:hypothetical protein
MTFKNKQTLVGKATKTGQKPDGKSAVSSSQMKKHFRLLKIKRRQRPPKPWLGRACFLLS